MPVSTEDYAAISDHLGRYCWAVDDGDADGWADLWTEDGVFTGVAPEPIAGREALKGVPTHAAATSGGKVRHMIGNLCCDYGPDRNTVVARFYNLVTNWSAGGAFLCMAMSKAILVRNGSAWLVKRNDVELFAGQPAVETA